MPAHRTLAQKWGSEPKQKGPRKPGRKPSGIDMTATSLRLSTAQLAAMHAIRDTEGISVTRQIMFAIDDWLSRRAQRRA